MQGSSHIVGAGVALALGALGVPVDPVGQSGGEILEWETPRSIQAGRLPADVLKQSAGTAFF